MGNDDETGEHLLTAAALIKHDTKRSAAPGRSRPRRRLPLPRHRRGTAHCGGIAVTGRGEEKGDFLSVKAIGAIDRKTRRGRPGQDSRNPAPLFRRKLGLVAGDLGPGVSRRVARVCCG